MKKLLWISRHSMTEEQLLDLKRIYGYQLDIIQCDKTIKAAGDIADYIKEADVIAAVLPFELLCSIFNLASGKPVIVSESLRVPSGRYTIDAFGNQENEYVYKHRCWKELVQANIEFKAL